MRPTSSPAPLSGRTAIEEQLELFEMQQDADRLIAGYSSGMRKKIAIIAGMLHSPSLLFLDEPTNALDAVSVRRLKDLLVRLKQRGVAILLTTHILEVVEKLADLICILHRGRKRAQGSLGELRSQFESAGSQLEDLFLALTDTGT